MLGAAYHVPFPSLLGCLRERFVGQALVWESSFGNSSMRSHARDTRGGIDDIHHRFCVLFRDSPLGRIHPLGMLLSQPLVRMDDALTKEWSHCPVEY